MKIIIIIIIIIIAQDDNLGTSEIWDNEQTRAALLSIPSLSHILLGRMCMIISVQIVGHVYMPEPHAGPVTAPRE